MLLLSLASSDVGAGGSAPSRRNQSVRLDLGEGCGEEAAANELVYETETDSHTKRKDKGGCQGVGVAGEGGLGVRRWQMQTSKSRTDK